MIGSDKQFFVGKKCTFTWYILHISLSLFFKFAITRKNDAFDAKIVNTCLAKIFIAIFGPDERLPSSATLDADNDDVNDDDDDDGE